MLFPYKKNIDVGYFVLENSLIPKFMLQDIVKVNENKFGCPAVGSLNNRIYEINSMFDIEIEFGFKNNEPYYKYNYPLNIYKDNQDVHNTINNITDTLHIQNTLTLQITTGNVFVTDNKNLELIVLPALEYIEVENCRFVSGSFIPYGWLRNINASWELINHNKPGFVKLSMNKPMITFLFNYPINLKEIEPSDKILNYHKYMYGIVNYRNKINKIFPHILSKRPKHLL